MAVKILGVPVNHHETRLETVFVFSLAAAELAKGLDCEASTEPSYRLSL